MNALLLYLILLKATLTSFSGLSSLPAVHHDLVVQRHVLTDRQLNTAVAISRVSPGPFGLYLVAVGYYALGWPGAAAGFCAMVTPAFLIVAALRLFANRHPGPRAQSAIRAVTFSSAGLVLASLIPIARDALAAPWQVATAVLATAVLLATRWDSVWVIAAGAAAGLLFGRVFGL